MSNSSSYPIFISRHGETMLNRARIMQGNHVHSPLSIRGFEQVVQMAQALRDLPCPDGLKVYSSTSGRAIQSAAIFCDVLSIPFTDLERDERLLEIDIGEWQGQPYVDLEARHGPILDRQKQYFIVRAEKGEWYDDVARRLQDWFAATDFASPVLVVTHGLTSRILRALLAGARVEDFAGAAPALAPARPQGTLTMVHDGVETDVFLPPDTGSAVA